MTRIVILLALACVAAGAAAAGKQLYKWTDANGVVHYSDAPPPKDTKDVKSVRLVGDTSSETPATTGDSAAKPAGDDKNKQASTGGADNQNPRAKKCDEAKRNLALLQSDYPVNEIDAEGKVKPVDDKGRESRIAGVKEVIAQNCGPVE